MRGHVPSQVARLPRRVDSQRGRRSRMHGSIRQMPNGVQLTHSLRDVVIRRGLLFGAARTESRQNSTNETGDDNGYDSRRVYNVDR